MTITMTTPTPLSNATVARYALEVDLKATPQQVWDALTDDIGRWWPGPFFMCVGPGPRRMSLDARPGGHMHEDAGGGNGMIWGTVIHVQKGKVLELSGSYGSPLTWLGKYELLAHENGTKLRFTEACFGHVTEAEMASKDHGWRYLYDGCMRAHLEGSEPPEWQDAPASSC
tara:strand:- start:206004 stop:206516 length:513 start_codon:yes stop_codon:yes gene_type:complete